MMIRVAPRFLITVLTIAAATAFAAAAHGPVAPKPEVTAPALLQELGRRVGLEPKCGCDGAATSDCDAGEPVAGKAACTEQ